MPDPDESSEPAKEFASELEEQITARTLAETIMLGLHATKTDIYTGKQMADWTVRHKFATLAAQYKIGKPLERKELDTKTAAKSLDDMKDLARKSPKFRATLIRMLDEVIADTEPT